MRPILSIVCLLLFGCLGDRSGGASGSGEISVQSDSTATAVLSRAGRRAIDRAVGALGGFDYLRERSVAVHDESGRLLFSAGYTTRFSGRGRNRSATVIDTTWASQGSAPFWEEYENAPTAEDTLEWSRRLLEDEPLVLSLRGSSYYKYSEPEDTTIGTGRTVRIRAELLSGTSRPGIQRGSFYLSSDTNELVGFDILIAHRSVLFDEESRFRYLLQPTAGGAWLPLEVAVNTFLDLPLTKGQHFELHARYSDLVPAGGD